MARGLPEGLVSNRVEVRDEIERVDKVEARDVQKLWRGTQLEEKDLLLHG